MIIKGDIELCTMKKDDTLSDLRAKIYEMSSIEPSAQIIEGINTESDKASLEELSKDDSIIISVTNAYADQIPFRDTNPIIEPLFSNSMGGIPAPNEENKKENTLRQSEILDILSKMKGKKDFSSTFDLPLHFLSEPIHSISKRSMRNQKPLLAFPYYPSHPQTSSFIQNVFQNPGFAEFVNENFTAWVAEMDENIENILKDVLSVSQYPLLLVLGEFEGLGSTVISILQGITDVDLLIVELLNSLDQYGALLENATTVKKPSTHSLLMQEQNREYEESLQRDKRIAEEKEMKKIQEEIERMKSEEEQQKNEEQEKKRVEDLQSSIPEEPSIDEKNVSKLNIRLPNGKRLERRFKETDTLQIVRNYIILKGGETGYNTTEFDLVNSYPRKVFENLQSSLQENGLIGRALLIVENSV